MPMPAPGMAARYSLCCQVDAFPNTMLFYCFFGINTASGCISACIWQQGRNEVLVTLNEQDERELYDFFEQQGQFFEGLL